MSARIPAGILSVACNDNQTIHSLMRNFLSQKIIVGCCLLLTVLVTTRIVFFSKFSGSLEEQIETSIRAIVESKKSLIELLVAQYRSGTEILAHRQVIIQALNEDTNTGRIAANANIGQAIAQTVKAYDLHNLIVLDSDLQTVAAHSHVPSQKFEASRFRAALTNSASTLIDIHPSHDGKLVFGIATPVHINGIDSSRVIGLVYAEVNAEEKLFPLINAWPRDAKSAETVLLERRGDDVVYLSPLRFDSTARPLEYQRGTSDQEYIDTTLPSNNETLFIAGKDYRDVPTYAAVSSIQGTQWILLSKLDQEEVRQPIILLRNVTILGAGIVSLLLIFVGRVLWLSQMDREAETKSVIEKNYNALVKASIDAYFALDGAGHFIDFNDEFLTLTGCAGNSLLHKKLHEVNTAYSSNLCDHLLVVLRLNSTAQIHIPWLTQDGKSKNVLLSGIHVGGGETPLREKFHFFARQVLTQAK